MLEKCRGPHTENHCPRGKRSGFGIRLTRVEFHPNMWTTSSKFLTMVLHSDYTLESPEEHKKFRCQRLIPDHIKSKKLGDPEPQFTKFLG